MSWKEKAIKYLEDSLYPIPTELNEIDWKSDLSPKSERLAQHLCAFSNLKDGGFLVFGVNNDACMLSITKEKADEIIKTLGNIALNNLSQSIQIQHNVIEYKGNSLLFIYIPEQMEKPVYLRGKTIYDSFHRSAGQTVRMSKDAVKFMISASHGISFESQVAMSELSLDEVLDLLDYKSFYERMVDYIMKNLPQQEIIKGALRNNKTEYPRRTIREFLANMLVHQDSMRTTKK